MLRKLFAILFIASIFASCNTGKEVKVDAKDSLPKIGILDFEKKAKDYVEKEVVIEGLVSHVCKEGGKKMFLIDTKNDSVSIKITSTETFDQGIVGSNVVVNGIVKELRIDEAYLASWEKEIKDEMAANDGKKKLCDTEANQFAPINELREEIKKSGSDHISYYSMEVKKYVVKK